MKLSINAKQIPFFGWFVFLPLTDISFWSKNPHVCQKHTPHELRIVTCCISLNYHINLGRAACIPEKLYLLGFFPSHLHITCMSMKAKSKHELTDRTQSTTGDSLSPFFKQTTKFPKILDIKKLCYFTDKQLNYHQTAIFSKHITQVHQSFRLVIT